MVVVVRMEEEEVEEVAEGTLVEAVEIIKLTPVGEGEDPITLEQIGKMTAVTKQLVMVGSPLHFRTTNKLLITLQYCKKFNYFHYNILVIRSDLERKEKFLFERA